MRRLLMIVFVIFFALVGCESNSNADEGTTKQLIIPEAGHYNHVYMQGISEEGGSNKDATVLNDDLATVKDVIKLVDRLVVKKPKYEKDIQSIKELDQEGSYILAFGDSADFRGKTYTIYLLKDGTVFYQDTQGSKDMAYVSVEKHGEVIEEVKKRLDVKF